MSVIKRHIHTSLFGLVLFLILFDFVYTIYVHMTLNFSNWWMAFFSILTKELASQGLLIYAIIMMIIVGSPENRSGKGHIIGYGFGLLMMFGMFLKQSIINNYLFAYFTMPNLLHPSFGLMLLFMVGVLWTSGIISKKQHTLFMYVIYGMILWVVISPWLWLFSGPVWWWHTNVRLKAFIYVIFGLAMALHMIQFKDIPYEPDFKSEGIFELIMSVTFAPLLIGLYMASTYLFTHNLGDSFPLMYVPSQPFSFISLLTFIFYSMIFALAMSHLYEHQSHWRIGFLIFLVIWILGLIQRTFLSGYFMQSDIYFALILIGSMVVLYQELKRDLMKTIHITHKLID